MGKRQDFSENLPVAVIGAGAGGLPAAVALAEQGISVVVIERGSELSPEEYPTNRHDYELTHTPWNRDSGEWRGPVELQRGIGVGGSTLYFQAVAQMPRQSVMAAWGLNTEVIDQIQREVVDFLQIAGDVQPHHPLNPVSSHLFGAAAKLEWQPQVSPVAILSESKYGRPKCNYCGCCIFGCRRRDKGSADQTWYPRAIRTGRVRFITNTIVDFIELNENKRAKAIRLDNGKNKFSLPVSAVIVAAGALETPYLLKQSRQPGAPNGIGNKHVGHNLTGSLWHSMLLSFPHDFHGGHAGIPIDIFINKFEDDGIILCQSRNAAGISGPVSASRFYLNQIGKTDLQRWMFENYQKLAGIVAYSESTSEYKDSLVVGGKKKIFEKFNNEKDEKTKHTMQKCLLSWAKAADANILAEYNSNELQLSGAMLRGTCRMGNDPEHSAVAPDGRLWGYDNISISDASILGPGVIAHPSLPIQVMGVYVGRSMAERIKSV